MKFHKLLYVMSLLILLSGMTPVANAQRRNNMQERWEYLGQSNVDGRRDHDNIRVNANSAFRAIQLRVQGGEIEFQRIVVHFENGADSEVEIRDRVRAGSQTRAIDLPGDNRRIKSVEVWYGRGNWGRRKPNLKLYGMLGGYNNNNMDANDRRRNRNDEQARWEYLGESNVDGRSDHDKIRVNANSAFRAIQLRVQGGEIEFQRIVVHFENGVDSEVEIRDRVRAGSQTRAIDLPGDNRRIENVEIWYGRGNWGRSKPNLKLYGQR